MCCTRWPFSRSQQGEDRLLLRTTRQCRSVTGMRGPSTANSPTTLAEGLLLRPEEAAHLLSVKTQLGL
jgi:hypothetical protein